MNRLKLLATIVALTAIGCAMSLDRSGLHYSAVFINTHKHEIDRVAFDASNRAQEECYVHGNWRAAPVPIWTDSAWHPEGEDGLSFPHPQCSNEGDFLADLDDAIHGAGLLNTDLVGVSVVQVTGNPSCKSESGNFANYDLCTNGYVIEINRGLNRADRQAALAAGFKALLQARLVGNPWGLGEPTGFYSKAATQQRLNDYMKLPGW